MIWLKGINKTFKIAKRNSGFSQAVKALFLREKETIYALNHDLICKIYCNTYKKPNAV